MGKKSTFVLDEQLMTEARQIIDRGFFKSMNSFVEIAIRDEIAKINKERIRDALVEASKDPLFLSDIEDIERDFEYADFDEGKK